jgi:hypothetical protein
LDLRVEGGGLADDVAVELVVGLPVDADLHSLSRVLVDLVILLGASGDEPQCDLDPVPESAWGGMQRSRRPSSGLAPGIKMRLPRSVPMLPITQSMA